MKKGSLKAGFTALVLTAASVAGAIAETYPSRPITFIVPWGPGGGADQLARMASKLMEPELKVAVPVINVPGATGQTGLTKIITSPADGYAIEVLTGDTAMIFVIPESRFKLETIKPLGVMIQQPSGLFANANGPLKSWDDVVKVAKERELKVAVTGYNSPDDVTVKYLKHQGINLQSIPFPEPGLRYSSILGGQADLLYEQAGDVRSFVDGKQIKPVIFFTQKQVPQFPDVPTSASLNFKVFMPQFRVIIARDGTSPEQLQALSKAISRVAGTDEYKDYLKQQYALPDSFVPADKASMFIDDWMNEGKALLALVNQK